MWRIVVCNGDGAEREQILEYARHYGEERQQPAHADDYADWQELIGQLKEEESDMVTMVQNGIAGMDIITSAHLFPRKCIWLSDLDLAIQAYRLCLSWFGTKPVIYGKVEQALSRCMGDEAKAGNTWR